MALPRPLWTFFSGRFKVRVHGAGCILVLTLGGGRMKTRRLFTAAVLSLFIAWVAAGAAEAQPRSIKGEVTDVATGDPLPGRRSPSRGPRSPPPLPRTARSPS